MALRAFPLEMATVRFRRLLFSKFPTTPKVSQVQAT
jgi:hypothetical protein